MSLVPSLLHCLEERAVNRTVITDDGTTIRATTYSPTSHTPIAVASLSATQALQMAIALLEALGRRYKWLDEQPSRSPPASIRSGTPVPGAASIPDAPSNSNA